MARSDGCRTAGVPANLSCLRVMQQPLGVWLALGPAVADTTAQLMMLAAMVLRSCK